MREMNKRGQQMTLSTIIAIVLGIAVLVFLIFGFSTGWNNMWEKITNLGGGEANVDDVVRGCQVACSGQSTDAYCRQPRTVNFGDGTEETGSCKTLEDSKRISIKSCSLKCGSIEIPKFGSSVTCDSLGGKWRDACGEDVNKADSVIDYKDKNDAKEAETPMCCVEKPKE